VLRWRLRRERLLYGLVLGARPWLLWLLAGCCEGWYCHWRLRSVRLGPVLSVFRILLSVLLFAGAFTSLLDGRLSSVRILAQKVRAGWVLIKRFPFPYWMTRIRLLWTSADLYWLENLYFHSPNG